jgi:hypothetical protein
MLYAATFPYTKDRSINCISLLSCSFFTIMLFNSTGTSRGTIRFLKTMFAFLRPVPATELNSRAVSFSLISSHILDNAKQLILSSGTMSSQTCASAVEIFLSTRDLMVSKFSFFNRQAPLPRSGICPAGITIKNNCLLWEYP